MSMITKECLCCKKHFASRCKTARFCSRECVRLYEKQNPDKCSRLIKLKQSVQKRSDTKQVQLICTECQKQFSRPLYKTKHKRHFCSLTCQRLWASKNFQPSYNNLIEANKRRAQQQSILLICQQCKKSFKRWKSQVDLYGGHFCSTKCHGIFKRDSQVYANENNPNWRGGISYEERPKEFFEIRKSIYKRDKWTCQLCQTRGHRCNCHHIDYNKKNTNPANLITLCRSCHGKTNFKRAYWTKRLKGFVKSR